MPCTLHPPYATNSISHTSLDAHTKWAEQLLENHWNKDLKKRMKNDDCERSIKMKLLYDLCTDG